MQESSSYVRESACNLCGDQQVTRVSDRDRRGDALGTVVCHGCGLVSHAKIPTEEEIVDYYAGDYRADYHGQATPAAHRVVRAFKVGKRRYQRLKSLVREGDRVFEVGAGLGGNLKPFEEAGHQASGIEPGESFQAFSRQMLSVDVENKTLEDVPQQAAYDFVLLVHVIEHLREPKESLRQIHGLLRSGGRLYVECPNVGAPHAAPNNRFHYAHIYNFTHETLIAMAQAAGFRVMRQVSADSQRDLMIVFEKSNVGQQELPVAGFDRSMEQLSRFSTLSYHLRPAYLLGRLGVLLDLYGDRVFAKRRLHRIIARCSKNARARVRSLPERPSYRRAG